jgi:hypothetical protein
VQRPTNSYTSQLSRAASISHSPTLVVSQRPLRNMTHGVICSTRLRQRRNLNVFGYAPRSTEYRLRDTSSHQQCLCRLVQSSVALSQYMLLSDATREVIACHQDLSHILVNKPILIIRPPQIPYIINILQFSVTSFVKPSKTTKLRSIIFHCPCSHQACTSRLFRLIYFNFSKNGGNVQYTLHCFYYYKRETVVYISCIICIVFVHYLNRLINSNLQSTRIGVSFVRNLLNVV